MQEMLITIIVIMKTHLVNRLIARAYYNSTRCIKQSPV